MKKKRPVSFGDTWFKLNLGAFRRSIRRSIRTVAERYYSMYQNYGLPMLIEYLKWAEGPQNEDFYEQEVLDKLQSRDKHGKGSAPAKKVRARRVA